MEVQNREIPFGEVQVLHCFSLSNNDPRLFLKVPPQDFLSAKMRTYNALLLTADLAARATSMYLCRDFDSPVIYEGPLLYG